VQILVINAIGSGSSTPSAVLGAQYCYAPVPGVEDERQRENGTPKQNPRLRSHLARRFLGQATEGMRFVQMNDFCWQDYAE
jgi:hypothetical protein